MVSLQTVFIIKDHITASCLPGGKSMMMHMDLIDHGPNLEFIF